RGERIRTNQGFGTARWSLPGLTRQSMHPRRALDRSAWTTGSSPVVTRLVLGSAPRQVVVECPKARGKPIVLPYPTIGDLFKGRDEFMQRLHESLTKARGARTVEALQRNLAVLTSVPVPQLDTTDDALKLAAVLDWLQANPGWFLIPR